MPRQHAFAFAHRPSYAPEDWLETEATRSVSAWISGWPEEWPHRGLVITGPEGSGKTHAAHLWASLSGARFLTADILRQSPHEWLQRHRQWVLDDADQLLPTLDESSLFHWFNLLVEVEGWLLLTASTPPVEWKIALPDLASRLRMLPVAALQPPDDAALAQLLVKWLADRQWRLDQESMATILMHAERSPHGVQQALEQIDRHTREARQEPTPARIRQWLT